MSQSRAACAGPYCPVAVTSPSVLLVSSQVRTRVGLGRALARQAHVAVVSSIERALQRLKGFPADSVVVTPEQTADGAAQLNALLEVHDRVVVLGDCGAWLDRHGLRARVELAASRDEVLTGLVGVRRGRPAAPDSMGGAGPHRTVPLDLRDAAERPASAFAAAPGCGPGPLSRPGDGAAGP